MNALNENSLGAVMARLRSKLSPKYGSREAASLVNFIFEQLKGWNAVDFAVRTNDEISEFIIGRAENAVERILNDEPVQYIFGVAHFYGMTFKVTPDTLIPRPETALLVDLIVKGYGDRSDLRVLDLGTGSGCIAIALARNLRFPEVTAVDISGSALTVARENAKALRANIKFIKADMLDFLPDSRFDIIVSNPPYIAESEAQSMERNVLDHEPRTALFVPDSDPLRFYRAIATIAVESLVDGGTLWLEINPLFSAQLVEMLTRKGFVYVEIIKDMDGRDRFAVARKTER